MSYEMRRSYLEILNEVLADRKVKRPRGKKAN